MKVHCSLVEEITITLVMCIASFYAMNPFSHFLCLKYGLIFLMLLIGYSEQIVFMAVPFTTYICCGSLFSWFNKAIMKFYDIKIYDLYGTYIQCT